jgi:delta1-piperideine-2-carboxylate reductase
MLAMDPARFGDPDGWLAHAEGFFAGLAALDGTHLPGDRRYANREPPPPLRAPAWPAARPPAWHDKILELSEPAPS